MLERDAAVQFRSKAERNWPFLCLFVLFIYLDLFIYLFSPQMSASGCHLWSWSLLHMVGITALLGAQASVLAGLSLGY